MLVKILAGLVMLSVLVIIHEFGHFVVARLFRVGVPVFSVGMGPRVGGFRWKGTDYRLSALPIGGYVQLAGADPFGEEDPDAYVDPAEDFMQKPVWQRFLVMLAGPAANLALPLLILSAILMAGEQRPDTVIGMVLPD
ncbi:MAG: site-2 protease family protein, partial [Deltaproteobacteria bacterium]|nr:site-2 protease family protein [Deltaproteobacteria bacterium]